MFSDIDPTAGAATEQELAEKYGKDNVRFLQCDVTDGSKFEGKSATRGKHTPKKFGWLLLHLSSVGHYVKKNSTIWFPHFNDTKLESRGNSEVMF